MYMEGISFDTDAHVPPPILQQQRPDSPKIIRWIVRWSGGRVDETGATYLFLAFALFLLLVAIAYPFLIGRTHYQEPPDAARHRGIVAPPQR